MKVKDVGAHGWTWLVSSRKDGRVVLWDVIMQPSLRDKVSTVSIADSQLSVLRRSALLDLETPVIVKAG